MANVVKMKRSSVASKVPTTTDLDFGELAVNTFDGKLFLKKDNGTASVVEIGKGDVVGPASATANALARFDSTTGKLIKNSSATLDDSGNMTVTKLVPNVQSVTSSATVTPNANSDELVTISAQSVGLTVANASGTPSEGQKLTVRVKDNGTAQTIGWGTSYVAGGSSLPTTTTAGKWLHAGFIYNSANTSWMCVAVAQEA